MKCALFRRKNNCEAVKEPEMEAGDFSYTFDSVITDRPPYL